MQGLLDFSNINYLTNQYCTLQSAADAISESFYRLNSMPADWVSLVDRIPQDNLTWSPNICSKVVERELENLDVRKAHGSDGLSARILKESSSVISGPISHLFALSIEECATPATWKLAYVTPVPKSQKPTIDDLRPISLLPIIVKILEKLVINSVKDKLLEMYGPNQFGFRPKSSTLYAHLSLHDQLTMLLDKQEVTGVVVMSFDLSKAFDRLSHASLCETLFKSNLPCGFIRWCMDYLQGRRQCVRLQSSVISSCRAVTSGVPQGSIIGPLLFAAHMGSLEAFSKMTSVYKYADDIIMIFPFANESEINNLVKNEIENISLWCTENGLALNKSKTKLMVIDKRKMETPASSIIVPSDELKILGVTFDKLLKWDAHVRNVSKVASQRIFALKQLKKVKTMEKEDLVLIYNAYILSILEYNCPLFVGINNKNSTVLEKIRKRCHRIICGMDCHCEILPSISTRRRNRALKVFKGIFNDEGNLLHHICPVFLPHARRLLVPYSRTTLRASSFFPHCTVLFNEKLMNL